MNINSTSNTNYVSLINSNLSGSVTAQPANCSGASQPAATLGISPAGDFLSKLQQLQSSNPAQFKQTMTDISNQLTSAAGNATGPQAQMLTALAGKFQSASQSGDLSAFQTQPGQTPYDTTNDPLASLMGAGGTGAAHHHHGHGHHHKSVQSGDDAASTQNSLLPQFASTTTPSTSSNVNVRDLFQSIFKEVDSAVSGSTSGASGGSSAITAS